MTTYSINAVTRRVVLSGSAGTGPYAFTFEIISNTDVAVFLDIIQLTLTTDYTVTINSNGTGSVTLNTGTTNVPNAPTNANTVTIVGARPITDFVTAGDLKASSLNEQLDALTIFDQQISERVDRALIGNISDPTNLSMEIPKASDRASKFLAFDSNGAAIAATQGAFEGNWSSGRAYSKGDIVKDTSTGNIFIANTAHTSSGSQPLTTNTDSAKWDLMVDNSVAQSAATTATNAAGTATTKADEAAASATAAGFSDDWAVKTDGQVDDGTTQDYSSKAYAIGGTGVTDSSGRGASKEWAVETSGNVDGTEYSAKEYAIGAQRRGQANGGSAKDWATYTGGTVDNASYSAKHWADAAAASVATFDNKYFGALSSDPTQDPDGSALEAGDIYYSSSSGNMRVYSGSQWEDVAVSTTGFATAGFSIAISIAL